MKRMRNSFLRIDRSSSPDLSRHLGGHKLFEQSPQALQLSVIDPREIKLENGLKNSEELITLEERIDRIDALGLIRLDAAVLHFLLDNQHLIPQSWKGSKDSVVSPQIYFEGTLGSYVEGQRNVFYIFPSYAGKWKLSWHPLSYYVEYFSYSAVVHPRAAVIH